MTKEQADWCAAARASIAQHEQDLRAALNKRDWRTYERLNEWRNRLQHLIAKKENAA